MFSKLFYSHLMPSQAGPSCCSTAKFGLLQFSNRVLSAFLSETASKLSVLFARQMSPGSFVYSPRYTRTHVFFAANQQPIGNRPWIKRSLSASLQFSQTTIQNVENNREIASQEGRIGVTMRALAEISRATVRS